MSVRKLMNQIAYKNLCFCLLLEMCAQTDFETGKNQKQDSKFQKQKNIQLKKRHRRRVPGIQDDEMIRSQLLEMSKLSLRPCFQTKIRFVVRLLL